MPESLIPRSLEQLPVQVPELAPEVVEQAPEASHQPSVKEGPGSKLLEDQLSLPQVSRVVTRSISPIQKSVEGVLEEGLEALYRELTPPQQERFKLSGEAVATKITELIQRVSVKVSDILQLIRQWLLGIPGINKYYLEQAAKIKADKILKLK